MPKFHVEKSILIDAPVSKVYECVSNLNHWNKWSPWLVLEPGATFNVADDGQSYSWEGERVGSGEMKILSTEKNNSVDFDLHFLKPWKSQADIRFEISEKEGKTEVKWLMDSKLPFFLFFMKNMMVAMLGMDFDRGLKMLQDYAVDDQVHSKLDFIGQTDYPGCTYIGITRYVSMDNMGPAMEKDFGTLMEFMADKTDIISNEPVSIYHKWEIVKGMASYTAAIPVSEVPNGLPDGVVTGSIPQTRLYKLRHIGKYDHLGNPWSAMMMMQRAKVFKQKKDIHPFESYVNSPAETAPKELITDVNFPIK
ncbi:SRPBCC family protein [Marinoscillum sp.]|uniref:SRPBCC family protein n=1 Tax=Marinoscillum sp. TaxID=2024838 RepID=UPI003BAB809B